MATLSVLSAPALSCASACEMMDGKIRCRLQRLAQEIKSQGGNAVIREGNSFTDHRFVGLKVMPLNCPGQCFCIEFEQEDFEHIRVSVDFTGTGDGASTVFSSQTVHADQYMDGIMAWFTSRFSEEPEMPLFSG